MQAGPVVNVHMPKDKVTQMHQGYGFVEFRSEIDADYAMKLMNMVRTAYNITTVSSSLFNFFITLLAIRPTMFSPAHSPPFIPSIPSGEVVQQTDPSE